MSERHISDYKRKLKYLADTYSFTTSVPLTDVTFVAEINVEVDILLRAWGQKAETVEKIGNYGMD